MDRTASAFGERLETERTDIWRYERFYEPRIESGCWLTIGEGWTKSLEVPDLAAELSLERLILKREDLNPTGSHKARSLAYQVSKAKQEGKKVLLISSSGNAAAAAASYTALAGMRLIAFVSPETHPVKLQEIERAGAAVIVTDRPINLAKYASRRYGIENLRPSTNDASIEGFKSIGFEIYETLGEVDAIFTFVSSGSSLLGIAEAYRALAEMEGISPPQLYAVHSGALSPHSEEDAAKGPPLAGRLAAKRTRRAKAVLRAVEETGGEAVRIGDEEIKAAVSALAKRGVLTSPEGVASFAALASVAERRRLKKAVCILTGHSSQWPLHGVAPAKVAVRDERELDNAIAKILEDSSGVGT